MRETIDTMDSQVLVVAILAVIDAIDLCDVGRYKAFLMGTLRSALNLLLISIIDDSSGTREAFENAVIQIARPPETPTTTVAAMVKNIAVVAPIAKLTAEIVRKETDTSVKELGSTCPSHSPSDSSLSSKKKEKTAQTRHRRRTIADINRFQDHQKKGINH